MSNVEKNEKIKQSLKETREKRKSQVCTVYKLKINERKLTSKQLTSLKMMFVEGKWFWNSIISFTENNNIKDFDIKEKTVKHFDKDHNEIISEYKHLSRQSKDSILKTFISNCKTLATLKKKGKKVGRIRYKNDQTTIPYKQYGVSHKIVDKNKFKLQKIGTVYVHGLEQFIYDSKVEYADCKLVKKPSGYYIHLTTFKNKENIDKTNYKTIGIDLGISTSITTSEGQKIDVLVQEPERLKRFQRKLQRQEKNSKNRYKTRLKIQKEYEKITNKKNDLANKIVHDLTDEKICVMQDEQISKWKHQFGKKIQHSVLGRVKQKLMNNPNCVVISSTLPTTKVCRNCGKYHDEMTLNDRVFRCECGVEEDRDIHASKNMIFFYKNNIGMGRTKFKHVEIEAQILEAISKFAQSGKHEASTL